MLVADIVMLIAGLLVMGLGVLSRLEKLPRNPWVGIRIPSVMETDETWEVGHKASARWTFGSGFFAATAALVSLTTSDGSGAVTLIGALGLLVLLLIGARVASRAARAVSSSG